MTLPLFNPAPNSLSSSTPARTAHLPGARRRRKNLRFTVSAALAVLVVVSAMVWLLWFRAPRAHANLVTAPVEVRELQFKVVERGTLEAKEPHDVKCEVKAGSRGAARILQVVENGQYVGKGELLVAIDDSYLQEQKDARKIELDRATADMIAARETYPQKKAAVALAERQLQKWIKGDFPQQLHDLEGQIQIKTSAVLQQEDRASWVSRMVKKGYMTASQLEGEQSTLNGDRLDLHKAEEAKDVLLKYTDPVTRRTLENALQQAKVDEQTAYATLRATEAIFKKQGSLYRDLVEQIKLCRIHARHSGIVVHTVPEQTRRGSGSNQSMIAQGEPVQCNQKILSIPDLSHMLVNVRIHEAVINSIQAGQPVRIHLEAIPDEDLIGRVKFVGQAVGQQDWMSPDVKVYPSTVEITGVAGLEERYPGLSSKELELKQQEALARLNLRPDLSAVCTIYTEKHSEHALAVPVQAILPPQEQGGSPRCFVQTEDGPEPREVELGISDEKFVEIKSGLEEGEEIVLNPQSLIDDQKHGGVHGEKFVLGDRSSSSHARIDGVK